MRSDNAMTTSTPSPTFQAGGIPIYGVGILSPMDGVSDWPFRSLCRKQGSAMSYTEFVRAADVLERKPSVFKKLTFDESERPVVFQLYGNDPDQIVEAALRVQELGPDIIDLNMGCPEKKVANRGAGVGMMRTPLKIARTIRKLVAALDVPITGKIRIGWEDCKTYKLVARVLEQEGGALVAIHGRTKEQGYRGCADWDVIGEVKAAVNIPVIGNGDIRAVEDIRRMQAHTGCDAVMIGRGAMVNPWIFSGRDRDQIPAEEVREFMREHLKRNLEFYGEEDGQRLFRKYVAQYLMLKRHLTREERRDVLSKQPPEKFLAVLDEIAGMMAEIRT